MSKWVNTEKFESFKKERENDNTEQKDAVDYARMYPNPKMGTAANPKEYHLRLIADPDQNFYKKYHYHMFQSGETWNFIMCPKTHNMDDYCPWCQATQMLYKGSASDKKKAYTYKRKDKYVGNVFVVKDPRDIDQSDEDKILKGTTKLYAFPQTIETLIKKEITDTENGWGYEIFNPENGYNLIINIGAKKADKNGKVWPEYALTAFARKPSSIAETDAEIEEIMGTCQNIEEYIDNSMLSVADNKALLKSEMLWDDVEDQFMRHMNVIEEKGDTPEPEAEKSSETKKSSAPKEDKKVEDTGSSQALSDEELMAELDNM